MTITKADFSRITVVLVDDNKFIRKLVGEILRSFGVGRVLEAESADEALVVMRISKPDLVISDWAMEPKDGLSVLAALREGRAGVDPKTPFILLTSERRSEQVVKALAEGADSYIAKPVSPSVLMTHLVKLIAAAREVAYID